jgi:hypothetical protein
VIGKASTNLSYVKSPENREWVLIIETILAAGNLIRPVVLFKGLALQSTWFEAQDCPDWLYGATTNG